MSSLFASNLFRSCAASVSSLARQRVCHPRPAFRPYSSTPSNDPAEAKQPDDKASPESQTEQPREEELTEDQKKLKQKEAEVVDLTGRLRYLQADFINLQRNSAKEKEQTRDFAITRFASDLLETADVLAMALKSVPQSLISPPTSEASDSSPPPSPTPPTEKSAEHYLRELYTGVEMTQRQLLQTLFKYHIKPFDPTGDKFDPNRHEALYQAPIPGKDPGTVIDCQKIGYTIKDRILRAAQVGVAQESS